MSIQNQINRDAILNKLKPKLRVFVRNCAGTYHAISTGSQVIYCPICKGPVVDSPRGRRNHVLASRRCDLVDGGELEEV